MSGSNNQVLLVVCALSIFGNVWQMFSGSDSECREELQQLKLKRVAKCPSPEPFDGGDKAGPSCPPCPVLKCNPCDGSKEGEGGGASPVDEVADNAAAAGAFTTGTAPEEGYIYGTERVASKTANTIYNPEEDKALIKHPKRYARSPVPKGSWRVRVSDTKWVTMDEVAFAYDVWFEENQVFQYMSWMGVFMQQDPMDAFAIQDMLWRVKPDLIIEIGSNTGGGAIFYATVMKGYNPDGKIVTLDVKDISNWNKKNNDRCVGCVLATEHKWWNDGMINFIKGRVTDKEIRDKVQPFVDAAKTVLVIEDASHRYPDTLQNIEASYQWVTPGSYLLVQDTKMDRFVAGLGRKYGKLKFGPMRSVDEFVAKHPDFVIDRRFEYFLYSQHHRGFLKRKK